MTPESRFAKSYVVRLAVTRRGTQRILKTATITAIDMISNIGGTLGLFSGFSVLSGLEIIYWMMLCGLGGAATGGGGRKRRMRLSALCIVKDASLNWKGVRNFFFTLRQESGDDWNRVFSCTTRQHFSMTGVNY